MSACRAPQLPLRLGLGNGPSFDVYAANGIFAFRITGSADWAAEIVAAVNAMPALAVAKEELQQVARESLPRMPTASMQNDWRQRVAADALARIAEVEKD